MLKRIGVLWKPKEGSKSKAVLSGSIDLLGEEVRVVVLKNDRKEKPSHPDFQIVRVLDDGEQDRADHEGGGSF
jgi:hypothetical protein